MRKINTLVLLAILLTSTLLTAQVYVSDLAIDGMNDGSTWANAYLDLGEAINNATEGDEIWIALGEYRPPAVIINDGNNMDTTHSFVINKNLKIYGGFIGGETSIEQRNPTFNPVILNGDINNDDMINQFDINKSDNARHILYLSDNITDATILDGLFIWRGYAHKNQFDISSFGGGIYCEGTPIIRNCTINECFALEGGGLFLEGFNNGSVLIENCDFDRNGAIEDASAIYADGVSGLSIIDTKVSRGNCENGASISVDGVPNVTIENCNIQNNVAAINVYLSDNLNIKIDRTNIENNHSTIGLSLLIEHEDENGVTDFNQSRILNNTADSLSAGLSQESGILNVTNSLIAGNESGLPVALGAVASSGIVNFNHATISSQHAPAVIAEGVLNSANSIFHCREAGVYSGMATINSSGGNICSDNSMDAGLSSTGDLTDTDPLFKSLMDGNYIPAYDSPCRDAAVNSAETVDIDGNARIGVPDIGAFENAAVATSQNEIPDLEIFITPTIAYDLIRVNWESPVINEMNYKIIDQSGQHIQVGEINSKNQKLDVSRLSSGLYYIVLYSSNTATSRSFVKLK